MMPIGVPTKVASSTIRSEPKIALAMPPASFGGGVISVKVASARPPTPRRSVSHRIQTSQNTPKAMAASDSVSATLVDALAAGVPARARVSAVGLRASGAVRRVRS